jgi:molybdopterin molybdotransferase
MSLIDVDEAVRRVIDATEPLPEQRVPLQGAYGRVLAESVTARWQLPRAALSIMDGYAARSEDLSKAPGAVELRRVGESAAGRPHADAVAPGEATRISTGAVVPDGCDIVIPQEDVEATAERVVVDLAKFGEVTPGRWIRAAGSDIEAGALVLEAGVRLSPGDLAAAGAVGHGVVAVHRRPVVAVVSTGDELIAIGEVPAPGSIIGTNGMMLCAQVEAAGGVAHLHGFVPDRPEAVTEALRRAMTLADVIVTTGGASVGDHDLIAEAWRSLGATFDFHGIALRPGKPTGYGRISGKHIFVLPGNPASALVTFELLVRPALRRLLGVRGDVTPPRIGVELRNEARAAGRRTHFVRARLHRDGTATVLGDQTSGNLRSIANFDAFVVVPGGHADLKPGESAQAVVVDPWWTERRSS